jgi:hypothetical protein
LADVLVRGQVQVELAAPAAPRGNLRIFFPRGAGLAAPAADGSGTNLAVVLAASERVFCRRLPLPCGRRQPLDIGRDRARAGAGRNPCRVHRATTRRLQSFVRPALIHDHAVSILSPLALSLASGEKAEIPALDDFQCAKLCPTPKIILPLSARNERGEGRGEGLPVCWSASRARAQSHPSPRPSPHSFLPASAQKLRRGRAEAVSEGGMGRGRRKMPRCRPYALNQMGLGPG